MRKRAKTNEGWLSAARELWLSGEREHQCEICGEPIEEPTPQNFHHLLHRGSYRKWKRVHRNIRIFCDREHWLIHNETRDRLERGDHGNAEDWIKTFKLLDELKQEANGASRK